MYILPIEMIYEINKYLLLQEIVNLYLSHKPLYIIFKETATIPTIKNNIHSNVLLVNSSCNYSVSMKEVFSKYFYKNIPRGIISIFDYVKWAYVFKKCFMYYNISFFKNDIILFTSIGTCNIFSIYKKVSDSVKKNTNYNYNYNYNNSNKILNTLAKERNLNALSKNWYHQLEYRQLSNLSYEILENL